MTHTKAELKQMQSMPLHWKVPMSKDRIKWWFEAWTKYGIYNYDTKETRYVTAKDEPKVDNNENIETAETGQVYVSFSGGKDSTVLADLSAQVCQMYGWDLYLVFVNTGLEYPEIQQFVKFFAQWLRDKYGITVHLEILRPKMRFDEVIKQYGYPVISKEVSECVSQAKINLKNDNHYSYRMKKLRGELIDEHGNPSLFNIAKYKPLLYTSFNSSHKCCDVMKKKPVKEYEKKTKRKPITAQMASESRLRQQKWLKNGCNGFNAKRPISNPMSFWTEQDVLQYIKENNLPIASVYGDIVYATDSNQMRIEDYGIQGCGTEKLCTTGCNRTGCIFCLFGAHLEKGEGRLERLKKTHPRQYDYCMNGGEYVNGIWQPNKQGLGMKKVIDDLNEIYGEGFIKY